MTKNRRPFRQTNAEVQIERRKKEICSLYKLAYQKDYNKSLNGSFTKDSKGQKRSLSSDGNNQSKNNHSNSFDSRQNKAETGNNGVANTASSKSSETKNLFPDVSKVGATTFHHFSQFLVNDQKGQNGNNFNSTRSSQDSRPAAVPKTQKFQSNLRIKRKSVPAQMYNQSQIGQQQSDPLSSVDDIFFSKRQQVPTIHQPNLESQYQYSQHRFMNINEYDDSQFGNRATAFNQTSKVVQLTLNKNISLSRSVAQQQSPFGAKSYSLSPAGTEQLKPRSVRQEPTLGSRDHDYSAILKQIQDEQKLRHLENENRHKQLHFVRKQSTLQHVTLQESAISPMLVKEKSFFSQKSQPNTIRHSSLQLQNEYQIVKGSQQQSSVIDQRKNANSQLYQAQQNSTLDTELIEQTAVQMIQQAAVVDNKFDKNPSNMTIISQPVNKKRRYYHRKAGTQSQQSQVINNQNNDDIVKHFLPVAKKESEEFQHQQLSTKFWCIQGEINMMDGNFIHRQPTPLAQKEKDYTDNYNTNGPSDFQKQLAANRERNSNSRQSAQDKTATLEVEHLAQNSKTLNSNNLDLIEKLITMERLSQSSQNEQMQQTQQQQQLTNIMTQPLIQVSPEKAVILATQQQFNTIKRKKKVQQAASFNTANQPKKLHKSVLKQILDVQQRDHQQNLLLMQKKQQGLVKKSQSLMLSANRADMHDRSEIVNSELRNALVTQGKRPKELFDDYKITLAKRMVEQGGSKNFDISTGGGRIAEISIKQRIESRSSGVNKQGLQRGESMLTSFDTHREPQIRPIFRKQSTIECPVDDSCFDNQSIIAKIGGRNVDGGYTSCYENRNKQRQMATVATGNHGAQHHQKLEQNQQYYPSTSIQESKDYNHSGQHQHEQQEEIDFGGEIVRKQIRIKSSQQTKKHKTMSSVMMAPSEEAISLNDNISVGIIQPSQQLND